MNERGYTAEEVAEILRAEGDASISKRTVNYYAFDKNMFEVSLGGKGIFSEGEINKLRGIRMLKECTNYSLEQIKKIINMQTLEDIKQLCLRRATEISYPLTVSEIRRSPYASEPDYEMPHPKLTTSPKAGLEKPRTIKVNNDVTLVVSRKIDNERLSVIIRFIQNLK
ncbi:MAG: MerR family transcriptional regulator [Dethiobacter sp.]|jgi:DNA-binding transcriptional MerR regulator|nr:MerR family transcriptional regulator [Dethiobacter sp.]